MRTANRRNPLNLLLRVLLLDFTKQHTDWIKRFIMIEFLFMQSFVVVCVVRVVSERGIVHILPYFVPLTVSETGFLGMLIIIFNVDAIINFQTIMDTKCCPLTLGGKEVQQKILNESSWVNTFCVVNLIYCTLVCCSMLPLIGDEETFLVYFVMIKGRGMGFILMIFTMNMTVAYYICIMGCGGLYISFSIKFQLYLLRDFIEKRVSSMSGNSSQDSNRVYEEIKQCAKFYRNLLRAYLETTNLVNVGVFFFSGIGVVTFIAMICFIYMEFSPPSNWRMIMISLSFLMNFLIACFMGQMMNDTSDDYHDALYNSPWYNWSVANQKLLLILMLTGKRRFGISGFGIVNMNKQNILIVARSVYSYLAVLSKYKQ